MSDDKLPSHEPIQQLWEKRGIKLICEVCQTEKWGLVSRPDMSAVTKLFMFRTDNGNPARMVFDAYMLVCQHCANIKFFSAQRISEILNER